MRESLSLLRSVCWMIPMLVGITSVMGFLSLLSSLFDSTGRLQHRVASNWGRMLMAVFMVKVRLTGAENLASDRAYVFASNHFSLIDTPLMFGFMPRPFRILARSGLWKIPFIGWHLNRAGHLPVHRENPRLAVRNIAFAAEKVRGGRSILVFPEGGRRRGMSMRKLKTGAAHIAIQSGASLVPVAISGTAHVLPPGSLHLRPGRVDVRFGRPLRTGSSVPWTARDLTDRLRREIEQLASAQPSRDGENRESEATR
ncbi:MAG: 1-acyl-sn-glycerol-3-phosphate acyltransferase [Acidobacteriia bacterium]|nr:1-acyl-sn-glycerol-3-phosphate acyltransferase [Terriglobia bacterium]